MGRIRFSYDGWRGLRKDVLQLPLYIALANGAAEVVVLAVLEVCPEAARHADELDSMYPQRGVHLNSNEFTMPLWHPVIPGGDPCCIGVDR